MLGGYSDVALYMDEDEQQQHAPEGDQAVPLPNEYLPKFPGETKTPVRSPSPKQANHPQGLSVSMVVQYSLIHENMMMHPDYCSDR
jgi:hypothetical protein